MFRKRRTWIIIIVVVTIIGGAYAYYTLSGTAGAAEDEEPPLQTSTARQGDIIISATAAGTVIPADEVLLSFPVNGVLVGLEVRVGDDVQAGDVLAQLDDGDAQKAILNSQIQLAQAAMKTDASTTETGISFDDIAIEQARINLDQAQKELDDLLNWEPDDDVFAQAEASLTSAESSYNAALGQENASGTNITVNRINVDQAERSLASAQEKYDTAWDEARDWELNDPRLAGRLENERASTAESLLKAQENLTIARANYNAAVSNSNSSSSTNAQTNLLNAQLALEAAAVGPSEDEIEAAQMAVRQVELNLQQALLNQETNALSLVQARMNLETAEEALDDSVLVAPIDGTIMAINGSVGESVGSGFITLADLEQPLLEVFLDETDMNMVVMGYEVEVVFDALPDEVFRGQVVQIDPQLVNQGGVTAVRALVQLDTDSFAKPQTLPVGMNATVEVIGGQAENTILVPVEALRELSPGEYAVFVMEDGEPILRLVEVGLMDFTFAEILSGVELGEIVTTGLVETN
ncbi:MAG TPA: efflux RND transporter periplasmic adaptor subunit [candidate division Zixibacteria bacterium]|nr:efflux RND transporter periplasmic adaptor subunit [candidate division Zixibacteria bacterium]